MKKEQPQQVRTNRLNIGILFFLGLGSCFATWADDQPSDVDSNSEISMCRIETAETILSDTFSRILRVQNERRELLNPAKDPTNDTPSPNPVPEPTDSPASSIAAGPVPIGLPISVDTPGFPVSPPIIDTFKFTQGVTERARDQEFVELTRKRVASNSNALKRDHALLRRSYQVANDEVVTDRLLAASQKLEDYAKQISGALSTSLADADRARVRNLLFNAADKAKIAADPEYVPSLSSTLLDVSSVSGNRTPAEKSEPILEAFPATSDGLVDRLVLLGGLNDRAREQILQKISFVSEVRVTSSNGTESAIQLLNNGFSSGPKKKQIECSSLLSSILLPDTRKTHFTTLDYAVMWIFSRKGVFPYPPIYSEGRRKLLMATSAAFTPIDIYSNEHPRAGDILVQRIMSEPVGQLYVVKQFNKNDQSAIVVDASRNGGQIAEVKYSLLADPENPNVKFKRPGIYILRLRPKGNRLCNFGEGRA